MLINDCIIYTFIKMDLSKLKIRKLEIEYFILKVPIETIPKHVFDGGINERMHKLFYLIKVNKYSRNVICDYIIKEEDINNKNKENKEIILLIRNIQLSEEHIEYILKKFQFTKDDNIIKEIFKYQKLTFKIIEKYNYLIHPYYISRYQTHLTAKQYKKIESCIMWDVLCEFKPDITLKFIKKIGVYTDYNGLSSNPHLDINIIRKFPNKLNWLDLSLKYKHFTIKIIEEFKSKIQFDYLSRNPYISLYIVNKFIKNLNLNSIIENNKNIDDNFIKIYNNEIDFNILSKNQYLSIDILENYNSKLNLYFVSKYNQNITLDFVKNHIDKIDLNDVLNNKNLNISVLYDIKSYRDKFIS